MQITIRQFKTFLIMACLLPAISFAENQLTETNELPIAKAIAKNGNMASMISDTDERDAPPVIAFSSSQCNQGIAVARFTYLGDSKLSYSYLAQDPAGCITQTPVEQLVLKKWGQRYFIAYTAQSNPQKIIIKSTEAPFTTWHHTASISEFSSQLSQFDMVIDQRGYPLITYLTLSKGYQRVGALRFSEIKEDFERIQASDSQMAARYEVPVYSGLDHEGNLYAMYLDWNWAPDIMKLSKYSYQWEKVPGDANSIAGIVKNWAKPHGFDPESWNYNSMLDVSFKTHPEKHKGGGQNEAFFTMAKGHIYTNGIGIVNIWKIDLDSGKLTLVNKPGLTRTTAKFSHVQFAVDDTDTPHFYFTESLINKKWNYKVIAGTLFGSNGKILPDAVLAAITYEGSNPEMHGYVLYRNGYKVTTH